MKKYFIAACCLISMAAISQSCNESKDFDTSTFQLLCEATGGSVSEDDATHCYCSGVKCDDAGVVCDSEKKCMAGSGSVTPQPQPDPNACNAANNGKKLCVVLNNVATMATCNGTDYVADADGACESGSCKADKSACEPKSDTSNEPVCDATNAAANLTKCVEDTNGAHLEICKLGANDGEYAFEKVDNSECASSHCNEAKDACADVETPACDEASAVLHVTICVEDTNGAHLEVCAEGNNDGEYAYKAVEENGVCASKQCSEDKKSCAEVEGPVCNAEAAQANTVICVQESDAAHLEICKEGANDGEYAFAAVEENGVCEFNLCNADKSACLVCDDAHLGKVCIQGEGKATVYNCSGSETSPVQYSFDAGTACESNACNEDGNDCAAAIVDVPECNAEAAEAGTIICVEEADAAHLEICEEGNSGEYAYKVLETDGVCASNKCNADSSACEDSVSNEPKCESDADVEKEICVEADGVAKMQVCVKHEATDETAASYAFEDLADGECALTCNAEKTACLVCDADHTGKVCIQGEGEATVYECSGADSSYSFDAGTACESHACNEAGNDCAADEDDSGDEGIGSGE